MLATIRECLLSIGWLRGASSQGCQEEFLLLNRNNGPWMIFDTSAGRNSAGVSRPKRSRKLRLRSSLKSLPSFPRRLLSTSATFDGCFVAAAAPLVPLPSDDLARHADTVSTSNGCLSSPESSSVLSKEDPPVPSWGRPGFDRWTVLRFSFSKRSRRRAIHGCHVIACDHVPTPVTCERWRCSMDMVEIPWTASG